MGTTAINQYKTLTAASYASRMLSSIIPSSRCMAISCASHGCRTGFTRYSPGSQPTTMSACYIWLCSLTTTPPMICMIGFSSHWSICRYNTPLNITSPARCSVLLVSSPCAAATAPESDLPSCIGTLSRNTLVPLLRSQSLDSSKFNNDSYRPLGDSEYEERERDHIGVRGPEAVVTV
ncbi:hypothetical protein BC629DRAFT_1542888 [Irpex lacteus]|nr:hypothetical protein BC629DRAFT_1542888 [Irpex lacteus]